MIVFSSFLNLFINYLLLVDSFFCILYTDEHDTYKIDFVIALSKFVNICIAGRHNSNKTT